MGVDSSRPGRLRLRAARLHEGPPNSYSPDRDPLLNRCGVRELESCRARQCLESRHRLQMSRDMCHTRIALLRPRLSAGVSSLVAPVTLVGLDPMARENLARVEGNERDLLLIDDGDDSTPGVSPQGHGAPAVGDVIAQAEVASVGSARRRPRGSAQPTRCR